MLLFFDLSKGERFKINSNNKIKNAASLSHQRDGKASPSRRWDGIW